MQAAAAWQCYRHQTMQLPAASSNARAAPCSRHSSSSSSSCRRTDRCVTIAAAAAAARSKRCSRTFIAAAFADTWAAPARPSRAQKEQQRQGQVQPAQYQQQQPHRTSSRAAPPTSSSNSSSSSSNSSRPHLSTANPAANINTSNGRLYNGSRPQPAQQQRQQQQRRSGSSSSSSSSQPSAPGEVLSSAVDKLYRQRLREVRALLSTASLEELQRGLTTEQLHSLQLVMQDLQDLQSSWEEDEEQLSTAEQQLLEQLATTQMMPDDFGSYLLAMLPEGSGPDELQQLMQSLDPAVLEDIQSVYYDLKEFEQSQLDLTEAQQRYVELSSRIAKVTARVQGTLAAQQQQQQQQQRQQQQRQQQQQQPQPQQIMQLRQPLRYSTIAFGNQQQEQLGRAAPAPSSRSSSSDKGSGSSSSSSGSISSRGWGSSWAKPRAANNSQPAPTKGLARGALFGGQQQEPPPLLQKQPEQQVDGGQGNAEKQQQQQQQPVGVPVRQRRRRAIIRRDAAAEQSQQ